MYCHDYSIAKSPQCLIDRVINSFKDHVMETRSIICIADVHPGAFAYSIESF